MGSHNGHSKVMTLGKRKLQALGLTREGQELSTANGGQDEAYAIFKRHFEARFKPLTPTKTKVVNEPQESESGDDTEWEGISEPGDDGSVEVVEHTTEEPRFVVPKELKAFMSPKPPMNTGEDPIQANTHGGKTKTDPEEADNLKNDLALQRLLTESHLLDSSSGLTLSGTNRHKAIDLRLRTLGSKSSIYTQERMPMSHRKGIGAKQRERENKRTKEARENGIILGKTKSNAKRKREGKRDRDIGGPGVGKFSGGTLKLRKKDILDIEGPVKKFKNGGRGSRDKRGANRRT